MPSIHGVNLNLGVRIEGGVPPVVTPGIEVMANIPTAPTPILRFRTARNYHALLVGGTPIWCKIWTAAGHELSEAAVLELFYIGPPGSGSAILLSRMPYISWHNLPWERQSLPESYEFIALDLRPATGRINPALGDRYTQVDGGWLFRLWGEEAVELRLEYPEAVAWDNANSKLVSWLQTEPMVLTPVRPG
jgi:hypothetical protein